jgi:hypothetical protein
MPPGEFECLAADGGNAPEYEAKTELCVTVSKSSSLDFFRPRGL